LKILIIKNKQTKKLKTTQQKTLDNCETTMPFGAMTSFTLLNPSRSSHPTLPTPRVWAWNSL